MDDFRSSPGFPPLFLGVTVLAPAAATLAHDGAWVIATILGVVCVAVLSLAWVLYRGGRPWRHVPRHRRQGPLAAPPLGSGEVRSCGRRA